MLMIHTIRAGDVLTMRGPDGMTSEKFTLAQPPSIAGGAHVWIYREFDAPLVVERGYALASTFVLHTRRHVDTLGS